MAKDKMTTAVSASDITPEMIEGWKEKYGEIFLVQADEKRAYLRRPDRRIISAAAVLGGSDNLKQKEVLIRNCWLGGDSAMMDEDKYFLGLSTQVDSIIEVAQVELKKV